MNTLLILFISLFLAGVAEAQVSCMQMGKFLTCDGPQGQNTTQMDLGRGRGVITDSQGHLETYRIYPMPSTPAIVPLPTLPQAPTVQPFDPAVQFEPIQPIQPIQPMFAPFSLGGDVGQ